MRSIVVCFFVVMVREVIEGLKGGACVGVEGDTILACTVEVLKSVDGRFIVLCVWGI